MTWQRRIEERLVELRAELIEGERAVRELDTRRERLVASMLRIGGAIQALEELVAEPGIAAAGAGAGAPASAVDAPASTVDFAAAPAEALPGTG